jgi:hypothetical protein
LKYFDIKKGLFNDQTSVDVVGHFQLATIKTKKRLNRYTLCLRLTGMTNISSSFWLVVSTPLKNMSMGRNYSQYMMEHKKCLKPPTSLPIKLDTVDES